MNKLVYLHELDSVRNTKEEIRLGQEAMYHEIVMNGNRVVLTYNQFTDSKAFLCAVKNDTQYKYILDLFKKGYIKLSNFVLKEFTIDEAGSPVVNEIDIYTPSQYFQHALEKNIQKQQRFIFSGIELDDSETVLMEIMCKALKYSNTSVFDQYTPSTQAEKEKVEELKKYTRLLLAISVEDLAYNPIDREKQLTLAGLLKEILDATWEAASFGDSAFAELFSKSVGVLKEIQNTLTPQQINARSNWLKELYQCDAVPEVELASAIVHLAYNYVVEDSIANVAKHYDETAGMTALLQDFAHRIVVFWEEHTQLGLHELHNPKNAATGAEFQMLLKWTNLPDWETAVRVTSNKNTLADTTDKIYEKDYDTDKKVWRRKIWLTVLLQIAIAFGYIFLIHIFNEVTGGIQNLVAYAVGLIGLDWHPALSVVINLLIYTVLLGVFSSYVSKKLGLPDILESMDDISHGFTDAKNIRTARKYTSYVWKKETNVDGE